MNRATAAVLMLTAVLVSPSCRNEYAAPVLSHAEHSGFGYTAGLGGNNAELLIVVDWPNDEVANIVVRCKALFDEDLSACTIRINEADYPLVIQESGRWMRVPVNINLKSGKNYISIIGRKPIKNDILIDYLEIE